MFFPQPRNLQNEIGNHVHETDGFDGDNFRASQQKYTVENMSIDDNNFRTSQQKYAAENTSIDNNFLQPSQQKYTVENASIGCSGKFVG